MGEKNAFEPETVTAVEGLPVLDEKTVPPLASLVIGRRTDAVPPRPPGPDTGRNFYAHELFLETFKPNDRLPEIVSVEEVRSAARRRYAGVRPRRPYTMLSQLPTLTDFLEKGDQATNPLADNRFALRSSDGKPSRITDLGDLTPPGRRNTEPIPGHPTIPDDQPPGMVIKDLDPLAVLENIELQAEEKEDE